MTVCYNNYFVVILDITSILKESPDEDELFSLIIGISDKWYDIGLLFQVHCNVLDDLKKSEGSNETKLKNLINIWKDTKPSSVTWETVIAAVESPVINNKEIADKIYRDLKLGKLILLSNELFYQYCHCQ